MVDRAQPTKKLSSKETVGDQKLANPTKRDSGKSMNQKSARNSKAVKKSKKKKNERNDRNQVASTSRKSHAPANEKIKSSKNASTSKENESEKHVTIADKEVIGSTGPSEKPDGRKVVRKKALKTAKRTVNSWCPQEDDPLLPRELHKDLIEPSPPSKTKDVPGSEARFQDLMVQFQWQHKVLKYYWILLDHDLLNPLKEELSKNEMRNVELESRLKLTRISLRIEGAAGAQIKDLTQPPLSKMAVCFRIDSIQVILEELLWFEKRMIKWMEGIVQDPYKNLVSDLNLGPVIAKLCELSFAQADIWSLPKIEAESADVTEEPTDKDSQRSDKDETAETSKHSEKQSQSAGKTKGTSSDERKSGTGDTSAGKSKRRMKAGRDSKSEKSDSDRKSDSASGSGSSDLLPLDGIHTGSWKQQLRDHKSSDAELENIRDLESRTKYFHDSVVQIVAGLMQVLKKMDNVATLRRHTVSDKKTGFNINLPSPKNVLRLFGKFPPVYRALSEVHYG